MNLDWCFVVVWPQRQTFVRILLTIQNQGLLRADARRLVLLGKLGAVVVGGGSGVADVGGAGGADDGDVEDGLGLVDVRVGDVGVACLLPSSSRMVCSMLKL